MADLANLAEANGMHQVDFNRYANALTDLSPNYMAVWPANDGGGTPWQYTPSGNQGSFELRSPGKDGAVGPVAPALWLNEPFEADLIMVAGQFTQMPTNQ